MSGRPRSSTTRSGSATSTIEIAAAPVSASSTLMLSGRRTSVHGPPDLLLVVDDEDRLCMRCFHRVNDAPRAREAQRRRSGRTWRDADFVNS